MKKLLALVFATSLIACSPAIAQPTPADKQLTVDPTSLALAHQIIATAFPPEKRPEMFRSMMDSLVEQGRRNMQSLGITTDKDFQALMDRSTARMFDQLKATMIASLPDLFESMSRAYARDFSTDDLKTILSFVQTPAGQHYFQRAPLIMRDPDVQAANQRMMAQLIAKKPELDRQNKQDIEDYLASKAKHDKGVKAKPGT